MKDESKNEEAAPSENQEESQPDAEMEDATK